jgi:hypothetical protein
VGVGTAFTVALPPGEALFAAPATTAETAAPPTPDTAATSTIDASAAGVAPQDDES